MKTSIRCASLIVLLVASNILAQEPPKPPAPQKEHKWLEQLVGEWESEMEGTAGPGQPAMKCKGTISARSLGGFWVISEMKADMFGMPMNAIQTVGYDTESKKYIGTWVDSMMNYMWKYEGSVDKTEKILTLEAEGPNFTQPGKKAKFRDIYEIKSPDHFGLTSQMQGEDGKWITFMTGNAKRKAKK